jgi:hypothetical protein
MKSYRSSAFLAVLAGVVVTSAYPLRAQTSPSAPIVVKETPVKAAKAIWLKAEVVHADRNSIVVREQANLVAVHTFTYSNQLKTRMEAIADQGGFQAGDKVKIQYLPGQSVALKVHGKPSKTL